MQRQKHITIWKLEEEIRLLREDKKNKLGVQFAETIQDTLQQKDRNMDVEDEVVRRRK